MTEDTEKKKYFAKATFNDPAAAYATALKLFGDDIDKSLEISRQWGKDPEVLEYQDQIKKDSPLPTKDDLVNTIWRKSNECDDLKVGLIGYRLIGEIMGYITKDAATNVTSLVDKRSVITITNHGTDDNWEKKVREQQKKLAHENRTRNSRHFTSDTGTGL